MTTTAATGASVAFLIAAKYRADEIVKRVARRDIDSIVAIARTIVAPDGRRPFGFYILGDARPVTYFLGGRIYSMADLNSVDPDFAAKLAQMMTNCGFNRVIVNCNGGEWIAPFNDRDVLLPVALTH